MSEVHQVVNLHSLLNPGSSKPRPIDRYVSPDFNVIVDLNDSNLRDFFISAVRGFKSEAIRADGRPQVNHHPIANPCPLPNLHLRINDAIPPDGGFVTDITSGTDDGFVPDFHPGFYNNKGLNRNGPGRLSPSDRSRHLGERREQN